MHEHEFQGQKLRHDHEGGDAPHGYFEHPEDGHRRQAAPLAEALAAVNAASADGFAADGTTKRHMVVLLHALADAARAHLAEMHPGDDCVKGLTLTELRRLVLAAGELWGNTERGEAAEYLSAGQMSALDKAHALYRDLVEGI
jgi:hypothetical protein